ncbi:MAG: glycoside hydrolase family 9 protein, partial [Flavobacteriaceae bacterium]|nr:glycoside hydrolase family 9 protein [Flavobacteriaceae bacterium]
MKILILLVISILSLLNTQASNKDSIYIRVNQMGYQPADSKKAIVFSNAVLKEKIDIVDDKTGHRIETIKAKPLKAQGWGTFSYFYEVDFSGINAEGRYHLQTQTSKFRSVSFDIAETTYDHQADRLLAFMQQQRCGYNPFFNVHCHQKDGITFYGTITPDSTFLDVSGGWHDAGDMLKYLITSSYATAHMLMAYDLYPDSFGDKVDAFGKPGANNIADVLDEAKWGLDWIFKLHPNPKELIHQVADDRDHSGFKYPDKDPADYGWGANSYRTAYVADGKPQGLGRHKSKATGVANLAGRSAAAMALAAKIWKEDLNDEPFANKCLEAAKTLYRLGRENEGYQQGNSYKEPYRYNEVTWADDMEWAAAELYKVTGEKKYLEEAIHYAKMADNEPSWIKRFAANKAIEHYELYPYINMGHFSLYEIADTDLKKTLASYYKKEIQMVIKTIKNPYDIGVPFIWCSNNLVTGLITQIILYEVMTGDTQYHDFMLKQRDWL